MFSNRNIDKYDLAEPDENTHTHIGRIFMDSW